MDVLSDVRRRARKPVRPAPAVAGQLLVGRLESLAVDAEQGTHAVLDTGRELVLVRTDRSDLEVGREYQARSRPGEGSRVVAWQLDELERLREREHDRGRARE